MITLTKQNNATRDTARDTAVWIDHHGFPVRVKVLEYMASTDDGCMARAVVQPVGYPNNHAVFVDANQVYVKG